MNTESLENNMSEILREVIPTTEIFTPTLFIRGAQSNYILDEDWEEIENHFPDSQLVTIENAGHWVHAEAPKEFLETVLGFCLR
jgi:pimeloyl-ACP methyl ester carboxylesterase